MSTSITISIGRKFVSMHLFKCSQLHQYRCQNVRSAYTELFERVMAPNTERSVIYPDSSGPEYGLRFLLNGDIYIIQNKADTSKLTQH